MGVVSPAPWRLVELATAFGMAEGEVMPSERFMRHYYGASGYVSPDVRERGGHIGADAPALEEGEASASPPSLGAVSDMAREFIAYYSRGGGCSNCGGLPHADTCFVGRFMAALADEHPPYPARVGSTDQGTAIGSANNSSSFGEIPRPPQAPEDDELTAWTNWNRKTVRGEASARPSPPQRLIEIQSRLEAWRENVAEEGGDADLVAIFEAHAADDIAWLLKAIAGEARPSPPDRPTDDDSLALETGVNGSEHGDLREVRNGKAASDV